MRRHSLIAALLVAIIGTPYGCTNAVSRLPDGASAEPTLLGAASLPSDALYRWLSDESSKPKGTFRELLYVTDREQRDLYRFAYPEGTQVGYPRTAGITEPEGECVDRSNNVWIADASGDVVAYPHSGHRPNKTLSDPGAQPVGCSVDPTTGNLAVTSAETSGSGNGSVAIYPNASGSATLYTEPDVLRFFFCAYDDQGNLFADGLTKHGFGLEELAKGASEFVNIKVDQSVYFPGGVEWDGRYLAVGDQSVGRVYQFAIKGRHAAVRGTTILGGAGDVVQFWLVRATPRGRARKLVAPDAYNHDVAIYAYPSGGSPLITFAGYHMYEPVGVALTPDKAL